ncbi:hypothetical protein Aduo_006309 [Ancylostoma duodenale]
MHMFAFDTAARVCLTCLAFTFRVVRLYSARNLLRYAHICCSCRVRSGVNAASLTPVGASTTTNPTTAPSQAAPIPLASVQPPPPPPPSLPPPQFAPFGSINGAASLPVDYEMPYAHDNIHHYNSNNNNQ